VAPLSVNAARTQKQQNEIFERPRRATARTPCFAVLSSLSIERLMRRWDEVTRRDKSKREERLVKALRDNLRRRKPALRKSAKAAPDSDAVPERAVKIEAKPTS
jgi:hypothetical protein